MLLLYVYILSSFNFQLFIFCKKTPNTALRSFLIPVIPTLTVGTPKIKNFTSLVFNVFLQSFICVEIFEKISITNSPHELSVSCIENRVLSSNNLNSHSVSSHSLSLSHSDPLPLPHSHSKKLLSPQTELSIINSLVLPTIAYCIFRNKHHPTPKVHRAFLPLLFHHLPKPKSYLHF